MKSSLRIAFTYVLLGGVWVTFSSLFLDAFQRELGLTNLVGLEVLKAILFVGASGVFIYFLVERTTRLDRKIWESYVEVFNNIPLSLWVVDKEAGIMLNSNKTANDIFGVTSLEKSTEKFGDFLGLSKQKIDNVFSGQKHAFRKHKLLDKNGRERVVDIYTVPFIRDGKEQVMVATVDNTTLHRSLLEKEILNRSLKEQNDRLRKLSFMNSHNLRGPLSNILGMVSFIMEEKVSKEVMAMLKESSEELDEEIRKMNEILVEEMVENNFQIPLSGHQPKSILIVDDDKVQHLINKRLLLKSNPQLELHFFANPLEALVWLEDHKVDLLLLDINMPEMKGWDFLDQLIKRKVIVEVKMLSSSIDPRDEEKSKQYNMVSGFLVKPLKKESLEEIL